MEFVCGEDVGKLGRETKGFDMSGSGGNTTVAGQILVLDPRLGCFS
jgi:hypothetical protein